MPPAVLTNRWTWPSRAVELREWRGAFHHQRRGKVLDVSGKIVAPGLVDVHTHVYHPGRNWNHPDVAGVRSGVTTIADAGGARFRRLRGLL